MDHVPFLGALNRLCSRHRMATVITALALGVVIGTYVAKWRIP